MRILSLVLMVLIGFLTYDIFQGKNGIAQYQAAGQQLNEARQVSERLGKRNQSVEQDIMDLSQGALSVEELARSELGLIKPGETFYRVINPDQNRTKE